MGRNGEVLRLRGAPFDDHGTVLSAIAANDGRMPCSRVGRHTWSAGFGWIDIVGYDDWPLTRETGGATDQSTHVKPGRDRADLRSNRICRRAGLGIRRPFGRLDGVSRVLPPDFEGSAFWIKSRPPRHTAGAA